MLKTSSVCLPSMAGLSRRWTYYVFGTISPTMWLQLHLYRPFVSVWNLFVLGLFFWQYSGQHLVHSSLSLDPEVTYIIWTILNFFDWLIDWLVSQSGRWRGYGPTFTCSGHSTSVLAAAVPALDRSPAVCHRGPFSGRFYSWSTQPTFRVSFSVMAFNCILYANDTQIYNFCSPTWDEWQVMLFMHPIFHVGSSVNTGRGWLSVTDSRAVKERINTPSINTRNIWHWLGYVARARSPTYIDTGVSRTLRNSRRAP